MLERQSLPPVIGLLFLVAVAGGVGWAATAETGPVVDDRPTATPVKVEQAAGAAASRAAEFDRRTSLD